MTELRRLDLRWNCLRKLPTQIGQLKNLRSLDLAMNHLSALPAEIGQLTKLEVLYLAGNELTTLPPEIGQLTKLKILDLSNNELTVLPVEVRRLPSTGLRYPAPLAGALGKLTRLTDLDLSGNGRLDCETLAQAFTGLTRLTNLDLRGCGGATPSSILALEALLPPQGKLDQLWLSTTSSLSLPEEVASSGHASRIIEELRLPRRPLFEIKALVLLTFESIM